MSKIKNEFIVLLLFVSSYGWVACEQSKKETASGQEVTKVKPAIQVSKDFQSQLDKTVKAYLSLKEALVASDTSLASAKAGDLLVALNQIDSTTLSAASAQQKWSAYKNSLERSAQTISASQKVEQQRVRFEDLSTTMYAIVNDFGSETTLYKQYCPMAFDDKGAFWLSAQSEIKNPYFGNAMLHCGEVQETLTFE